MVNNDDVGYFKGQDNKCLFINTMSDDFPPPQKKKLSSVYNYKNSLMSINMQFLLNLTD